MTESRAHASQVGVRELPKTTPIADLEWRNRARVAGRVKSLRLQPRSEVPTLECVLVDESGATITLVFLGRRSIAGLRSGTYLAADGMVGKYQGKVAMINPLYELLAVQSDTKTRARNATKRRQRQ
jgi:RecG-like helicase